jgi:hypothetical protein
MTPPRSVNCATTGMDKIEVMSAPHRPTRMSAATASPRGQEESHDLR